MLPERVARARDLCARWVTEGHTPTLGVCVARRGVVVLNEAFGVLGPGPDSRPLERGALFPVMSITKPITATLVMQLVEDGLLGLNRPAKDYLPEISGDGTDEILVHHLLTHTTGYPFQIDPPWIEHRAKKLAAGFKAPPCPEGLDPIIHQWLSLFWDAPRVARVGEVMVYSSHNYELLAEIVRRLSGRGLEDVARERIFDPLGMHDTYYVVPESESHRVVQRAPDIPFGNPEEPVLPCIGSRQWQRTPYGGAGAFSTPRDMAVFGQMFLNRGRYGDARILSPAAVAAMTRDQVPGLGALLLNLVMERASWGYGWQIVSPTKWKYFDGSLQPLGTFGHPGAGGVNYWIDRDHELVGAYFEVTTRLNPDYNLLWNFDLFQNAITAAVED
ncbi:MAG: beta-lactamase family protein [Deltaproteobacteria bacterium]|nr:beta-lactamase family protein [Deltaproteobacteria bacterium]